MPNNTSTYKPPTLRGDSVHLHTDTTHRMIELSIKSSTALSIYHTLLHLMPKDSREITVTRSALAEWLGVSKVTITTAIKALEQSGLVAIRRDGRQYVYTIV